MKQIWWCLYYLLWHWYICTGYVRYNSAMYIYYTSIEVILDNHSMVQLLAAVRMVSKYSIIMSRWVARCYRHLLQNTFVPYQKKYFYSTESRGTMLVSYPAYQIVYHISQIFFPNLPYTVWSWCCINLARFYKVVAHRMIWCSLREGQRAMTANSTCFFIWCCPTIDHEKVMFADVTLIWQEGLAIRRGWDTGYRLRDVWNGSGTTIK